MPNIMQVLKAEITRLAKKQAKLFSGTLAQEIKKLKRTQIAIKKELATVKKQIASAPKSKGVPQISDKELEKARLSPGLLKKLRKKLDLSQANLAKLIGVSVPAIVSWESGRTTPTKANKAKIVAVRRMGKRELKKMLAEKGK